MCCAAALVAREVLVEVLAGLGYDLVFATVHALDANLEPPRHPSISTSIVLAGATYVLVYGVIVFMLLLYGVLSLVVTIFVTDLVPEILFIGNFSAWYGSGSLLS